MLFQTEIFQGMFTMIIIIRPCKFYVNLWSPRFLFLTNSVKGGLCFSYGWNTASSMWGHDKKEIFFSPKKNFSTFNFCFIYLSGVGDVYFSSITKDDEGSYFCVATNDFLPQSVTSDTAVLSVRGKTEGMLGNSAELPTISDSVGSSLKVTHFSVLKVQIFAQVDSKRLLSFSIFSKVWSMIHPCKVFSFTIFIFIF